MFNDSNYTSLSAKAQSGQSADMINRAYKTITKKVEDADGQDHGVTITNKVYLCADGHPALLNQLNTKMSVWLNKYVNAFQTRFKPLTEQGLNKTICLDCLSDDCLKQLRTNKPQELAYKVKRGIIIPLDKYGNLLSMTDFEKLVFN